MENILETFYPTHPEKARESNAETVDNIPLFREDELSRVGRAGTPAEVLKAVVHACPQLLLNI